MKLANLFGKGKLGQLAHRAGAKLSKHSPEILLGVGIVGFIGTAVLASTETLKLEQIVDEHERTLDNIERTVDDESHPQYGEEEAVHDKYVLMCRTGKKILKLYAPAICLGVASTAALIGSHYILMRRQAALTAAYVGMKSAYDKYRDRVKEALGDEKEKELYLGVREETEVIEGKNGKPKEITKKVFNATPFPYSPYAAVFDNRSRWWVNDLEANKRFLRMTQSHCCDILKIQGHLFLNEVYDLLDITRTTEGQMVGWVLGNGDSVVNFDMADVLCDGSEKCVALDFNVDGEIYQLI